MYKFFRLHLAVLIVVFLTACAEPPKESSFVDEIMAIKTEFAPDKRVALFDVTAEKSENTIVLKGETNMKEAVAALKESLSVQNMEIVDSIQTLPSADLEGKTNAVITISVANLRSNPKHSAELATQATLGTPVKVLKKEGDWFYIQTPDKYLSWVDAGGIALMDDSRFQEWKSRDKIIYTKTYGNVYNDVTEKAVVSDVVAGNVLEFVNLIDGFFVCAFPDGRMGLIRTDEAESYFGWINAMNPTADDLVGTSKKLMGVPYLWGGTSTKGMDCSGFTKTVYFLNGMVIPRDASQQVHTGKQIDEDGNFDNLQKGDLLFFGRKATDSTKEKVVHVGMWIGNDEFIHASNMVRVSSMNPNADNFDEFNLNRYLRSKRILKEEDKDLIDLTETPIFK